MGEVKGAKLPLVFLAKAIGLVKERPTGIRVSQVTIYVYEDDGLPEEAPLGKGTFLQAVEDMNLSTLNKIEMDVTSRVKLAEHAKRLEWFDSAKGVVKEIYELQRAERQATRFINATWLCSRPTSRSFWN